MKTMPKSSAEHLASMAASLQQAERTRTPIAPFTEQFGDISEADAYRIQSLNTEARTKAGERIVGRKIGLTSPAVQKQLGVDQPDFGTLFAGMSSGDNQTIVLGDLI